MANFQIIKKGVEARNAVIKGANFLADAVKSTLGPYGANALIEKGNRITNDGVTISREISAGMKDELERRGAIVLHEAASKTNDQAGDGTTTAIILAQAILKEATSFLGSETTIGNKKSPTEIIKQIQSEKEVIEMRLMEMAEPIKSEEDLINSAIVSVEDKELGKLIGEAQWKLGKDGLLLAEETAERESSVEFVNGVRIDNGFGTSIAINNVEKQALELSNVKVILTNYTFPEGTGILPIMPVLKQVLEMGSRDIVIVSRAFSETAIRQCMENQKTGFRIYPINAPYVDQNEVFKDLQAVLGGRYINTEDSKLEDIMISDVGFAEKILAKRYSAIFTGKIDEMSKKRVEERVEIIKKQIKTEVSDFHRKQLNTRLAQLTSGFGIVKIGATSETERKYKKDKAEDAVNAVRLALQDGTVKGAGLAFKEIAECLPDTYILKRPLMSIYQQIALTSPNDFVVESWVRDPIKVLMTALTNACSVAGTLASTAIVIAYENPKPKLVVNDESNG